MTNYIMQVLFPDQPFPQTPSETTHGTYLSCMVAFARFAGEIWDQVFALLGPEGPDLGEKITVLDARIQYWLTTTFPSMSFSSRGSAPTTRQLWQQSLVRTVSPLAMTMTVRRSA
jgi:hypothetical protein